MEKLQPYQMTQAARAILDNRQAMEAWVKGERVARAGFLKGAWYEMKGGNLFNQDGKPVGVAITPGDKWRIIPPVVEELSFMEAVQIPGTWQKVGSPKVTMRVNKSLYVRFLIGGSHEPPPFICGRFSPDARYVRIGDA